MKWLVAFLVACASGATPKPGTQEAPKPTVTPLPIVTPIAEPFEPTSFTVKVSGRGRPVILIPGLGCPGAVWDETVAHLANTAETHVLTLAGFAGQPAITGPLNATVRQELARYITDRHLSHPVVIGHSMGGFLAFWLAAAEPDLVGPTIVVDALPALGTDSDPAQIRQLADGWRTASDADFVQQTRDFFSTMSLNPVRMAPVIAAVSRSDHRAFADAFYELFTTDIRADLPQTRAPVLVVLADTAPLDTARQQTAAIPLHEVVVVPNTRHFVFFDDPGGFYELVDSFLAAHP
jgi:pimeloyl-ACP methyl ester carboxylesterase